MAKTAKCKLCEKEIGVSGAPALSTVIGPVCIKCAKKEGLSCRCKQCRLWENVATRNRHKAHAPQSYEKPRRAS